jgi:1-acyl-sn-glycerol-3-phosphate acyltransferase
VDGRSSTPTLPCARRLEAGAVLCLFLETGPATRRVPLVAGPRLAYFALRTDRPIVPIILGGTHELYRGRRFRLEILPPLSARELAGWPHDAPLPEPWSKPEREAAHRIVAELHARTAEEILAAHRATESPVGARRRWRWLTSAWH